MSTQLHGWYSEKHARAWGTLRYSTPDGGATEVTCVSDSPEHGSSLDDLVFVGMVTECLGQGSTGMFSRFPFMKTKYEDQKDPSPYRYTIGIGKRR